MSDADGSTAAMDPVVRKMPDPITLPMTKRVAEPSPSARTSPSSLPAADGTEGVDTGRNCSTGPRARIPGLPPWTSGTLAGGGPWPRA